MDACLALLAHKVSSYVKLKRPSLPTCDIQVACFLSVLGLRPVAFPHAVGNMLGLFLCQIMDFKRGHKFHSYKCSFIQREDL